MSGKGAITISHDELVKMKMRANVIPNRMIPVIMQKLRTTWQPININRVKNELISGSITPRTSRKGKRMKGFESLRRRSWNAEK